MFSSIPLAILLLIADAIALDIDWRFVAMVASGSLSGGAVLEIFQPAPTPRQRVIKIILSMVASLFVAPAVVYRYQINVWQYVALTAFLHGFLILLILKSVFTYMQRNAGQIISKIVSAAITRTEVQYTPKERRRRSHKRLAGNKITDQKDEPAAIVTTTEVKSVQVETQEKQGDKKDV